MSSDSFMIDSFISYMATNPEEDPFSDEWKGQNKTAAPAFDFNKIIRILLLMGLGFILICSPILCIFMLVVGDFSFEGAWLSIAITVAELGYLIRKIILTKSRK